MADEYGLFWNSRGGDRVYSADSMEEWLKPFFTTGVFANGLTTLSSGGMKVTVNGGYANINSKVRCFEEGIEFTLETPSTSFDRCDTIVIERHDGNREITMKVVTGTSATPIAPVRESGVYQLVIAQILVAKGVTEITQADITDTRGDEALCGIVATPDTLDYNQAYLMFTEQFEQWFNNIKGQLGTDVAGHLQNEIDEKRRVTTRVLSVSNWDDKQYDLTSDFPDNEYDIEIAPYINMSDDQLSAYNNAVMMGDLTTNKITAKGITPSIDIPVMIIYYTK